MTYSPERPKTEFFWRDDYALPLNTTLTIRLPKPLNAAIRAKAMQEKVDPSTIARRLIALGAEEAGLKPLY